MQKSAINQDLGSNQTQAIHEGTDQIDDYLIVDVLPQLVKQGVLSSQFLDYLNTLSYYAWHLTRARIEMEQTQYKLDLLQIQISETEKKLAEDKVYTLIPGEEDQPVSNMQMLVVTADQYLDLVSNQVTPIHRWPSFKVSPKSTSQPALPSQHCDLTKKPEKSEWLSEHKNNKNKKKNKKRGAPYDKRKRRGQFVCGVCVGLCVDEKKNRFCSKFSLTRHLKTHDEATRNQSCAYGCGAKFRESYQQSRHHLTHTNQKLYHCPSCGKSYKALCTLQRHKCSQPLFILRKPI